LELHVAVLFDASVAVQVTVVHPDGSIEPDGGLHAGHNKDNPAHTYRPLLRAFPSVSRQTFQDLLLGILCRGFRGSSE
jgi:hypothetical protein